MSGYPNAMPRVDLQGIQDLSTRQLVAEAEQLPQHLVHAFGFAERGSSIPQLVVGSSLAKTFGANSFDYRGKYANHQTAIINTVNANANTMLFQRLKPDDAATAKVRLSLEIVPNATITKYQRDPATGQFLRDGSGALVPVFDQSEQPVTITGLLYVWHLNYAGQESEAFGAAANKTAVYPRGPDLGQPSTIYPIMEFEVASFGAYGNNVGLRLSAPTALSTVPPDISLEKTLKQFMYRFQIVERPDLITSPAIIQTQDGDSALDLVLGQDIIHPTYGTDLSVDAAFVQAYQDLEPLVGPVVIGEFGRMHLYRTQIAAVQEIIRAAEAVNLVGNADAWVPMDYTDTSLTGLINILNGVDYNGAPYESVRRATVPDASAITFDPNGVTTVWAKGGSDGDISLRNFDLLVRQQCANYGDLTDLHFLDMGKYPQSAIYDSGFSLETKKAIMQPTGRRKDMYAVIGTHACCRWLENNEDPENPIFEEITTQMSPSEESSMGITLRTAAEALPESEVYGTPVVRILVVKQSGRLINSQWKGLLPLTVEIAYKFSRYMGAGNGSWNSVYKPNVSPNNQVQLFKDVNNQWVPKEVYNKDWENGIIWAQTYDTKSLFFPAFQTQYPDDTSIFNSAITMTAAVELEKVCFRVWRDLTGRDDLTEEQFIEQSNEMITTLTQGRFDGRFVIVPETYYTPADSARGFSWSCKIHLYANNMKTVGVFTIVGHRMSDLAAA